MTININTGCVQTHKPTGVLCGLENHFIGKVTEFDDTTPSELVVFPSNERTLLNVEPNTMVVVTGYNIDDETVVSFYKVLRSNGIPMYKGGGCCSYATVANTISLYRVNIPSWKLSKDAPLFVIKTPGNYEIDVTGSAIDVVVTAVSFKLQETNVF